MDDDQWIGKIEHGLGIAMVSAFMAFMLLAYVFVDSSQQTTQRTPQRRPSVSRTMRHSRHRKGDDHE